MPFILCSLKALLLAPPTSNNQLDWPDSDSHPDFNWWPSVYRYVTISNYLEYRTVRTFISWLTLSQRPRCHDISAGSGPGIYRMCVVTLPTAEDEVLALSMDPSHSLLREGDFTSL
ncbi:uncharacterized protein PHACADRAFT_85865 [Phanerochaete carnosa HHB-10118-sp]|uniref:Uncharacterized protein n=1 Tax=Phanerochaete carnosa (strain HHB-10118-sp) TaxID=650164 RepID=K5WI07_PHACS|nr:uncharacterized protein PHACADRAFT_85865 [Phanerochaete carnosa HHB-10118-sp]EKM58990.1 hypothetical protein PHACADRAFT_85865 [Phanerochaete carnosa HHB-10118-sp]